MFVAFNMDIWRQIQTTILPEKTRETVLDMAGEPQDGDTAEGEEPDTCEGNQEPEHQLSGEEGSSEGRI